MRTRLDVESACIVSATARGLSVDDAHIRLPVNAVAYQDTRSERMFRCSFPRGRDGRGHGRYSAVVCTDCEAHAVRIKPLGSVR